MSSIDLEINDINESNHEKYNLIARFVPAISMSGSMTYAFFGDRGDIIKFLTNEYCTVYGQTDDEMLKEYIDYIID